MGGVILYSCRVGGIALLSTSGLASILAVVVAVEAFSLLTVLSLLAGKIGGMRRALRHPAFWVAAAISAGVVAAVIASTATTYAGYVITGNCSLVAETSFGTLHLDLRGADVSLADRNPVAVRVNGLGLPGVVIGWVRLTNGKRALAIVYHPPGVYLVVEGGGRVFVASHPGVREAYRVIMGSCKGIEGSG